MPSVLIVDDDPAIAHALAITLASEGYIAVAASDGHEALGIIERQPIDVILSDIMMPRVNGHQLIAALRERGNAVPVVLMSAAARNERIAAAGVPFMQKPFDLDEVLVLVGRIVAEQPSRGRQRAVPPALGRFDASDRSPSP